VKEYGILVPLADNAGEAFPSQIFEMLEAELLDHFGGFTRQDGGTGVWRDPATNRVYRDPNCVYIVATADRKAKATILALARRWCVMLAQEAIYVRLPGGNAVIVAPDDG
jgi:hypothetical protein